MKAIGTYPNLRMRRNRKADWIRRLISEYELSANDLILPLFVKEGRQKKDRQQQELARQVETIMSLLVRMLNNLKHLILLYAYRLSAYQAQRWNLEKQRAGSFYIWFV